MTTDPADVILGVDTHKHTHHAATIDAQGRLLGHREFAATEQGQLDLLNWAIGQGQVRVAGVKGTGSYGAGLARLLRRRDIKVIDVNRPNRQARHLAGKNDVLDAEQAARSVLSRVATAQPKAQNGSVEVIRMLRITRGTAIKARTQSMNALQAIIVTAPDRLREQLRALNGRHLIKHCASLRPAVSDLVQLAAAPEQLLIAGAKTALRELAQRWTALDQQIKALDKQLAALVEQAAPQLLTLPGVGPDSAGQMLVTAGDNPERLKNEAAFARLCGVAPQPASSGRTTGRHRLSRGGDREANRALYMIIITRLRRHDATKAYVARRTSEGLSKREIIRCLKRYLAREIYTALSRSAA
jgi:transposase